MYRTINETKVFVKVAMPTREIIEKEFVFPEKIDTEKGLEKVRKVVKVDGVVLWGTLKVKEISETQYSLDDALFTTYAKKIDKPNPALITRTVNETLIVLTTVNDEGQYTETKLSFNGKVSGDDLPALIEKALEKGTYLFSIDDIKVNSGLYGIEPVEFMNHAIKGETKVIYKEQ